MQIEYLDSSNFFKVLFQGKLYLCHKNGYQVSQGFDNIIESKAKGFFEVEVGTEFEKKLHIIIHSSSKSNEELRKSSVLSKSRY